MSEEDTGKSDGLYDEDEPVLVEIAASAKGVHLTFRHPECEVYTFC